MSTFCVGVLLLLASNSKPGFGADVVALAYFLAGIFVFLSAFREFREFLRFEVN